MEGVWLMLQQKKDPQNYVLASGEMHSVREFLELSLEAAGINFYSTGHGEHEKFFESSSQKLIFEINPKFYRPAEVHELCGDPSRAEKELGWKRKTNFKELVSKMYQNDYELLSNG